MRTFTQTTFQDEYCTTAIAPQIIEADFRPEHGADYQVIIQTS